jgi:hypothetical protein
VADRGHSGSVVVTTVISVPVRHGGVIEGKDPVMTELDAFTVAMFERPARPFTPNSGEHGASSANIRRPGPIDLWGMPDRMGFDIPN